VTATALLGTHVFGEDFHQNGAVFLPLIFGSLVLSVFQTIAVYKLLQAAEETPAGEFWRDLTSPELGGCTRH